MTRRTYVFRDGEMYEKGTEPGAPRDASPQAPAVLPDLPDFVSPIDQSVVKGRAGMRDHCARHNVVPTADLKGLPHQRPVQPVDRVALRETIKRTMIQKGLL